MSDGKQLLGLLGGMGPLASAEFLKTIYEYSGQSCEREQDAPSIVVFSDPSFPDRTEAFLGGNHARVLERLVAALDSLSGLGAEKIVICCMTIHYLLPELPGHLRARVVSLLDVIFDEMEREPGRHLLICSTGTRRLGIFQRHERWGQARDRIAFPTEDEQRGMHDLIYEVKQNRSIPEAVEFLKRLMRSHGVNSFIAGCSEVHLLAKHFPAYGADARGHNCIDPLAIIARRITERNSYGL